MAVPGGGRGWVRREPGGVVGAGLPGGAAGPVVPAAGSRVAGYVLEEEIGAGGMAVVFRALHETRRGSWRPPACGYRQRAGCR